jgi:hypothetical protein
MKYIVKYLLRKEIIQLLKIEDTFFLYKELDKRLILTKDIIALNYIDESPYPSNESSTVAIINQEKLYLWFFKKTKKTHYLPESLSFYRKIVQESSNIIVIIQGKIDKTIIIKNGFLVSSFSKLSISEEDLLLIKDEYGVSEILWLRDEEYIEVLDSSLDFIKISDLLSILDIQFDFKKNLTSFIKWLSIPFLVSSIVISIILGMYSYFIEDKNHILYDTYKNSQLSTIKIKNKIDKYEIENKLFTKLAMEFRYVDKGLTLSKILKTAKDLDMTIIYLKIYDKDAHFIVKTKDRKIIPLYIKQLFQTELFEDIKNLSSQKQRDNSIEVTMRAKLRERV